MLLSCKGLHRRGQVHSELLGRVALFRGRTDEFIIRILGYGLVEIDRLCALTTKGTFDFLGCDETTLREMHAQGGRSCSRRACRASEARGTLAHMVVRKGETGSCGS